MWWLLAWVARIMTLATAAVLGSCAVAVLGLRCRDLLQGRSRRRPRIAVFVLGDLGRSPRMQYHALSLARDAGRDGEGVDVELLGLAGEPCIAALREHPNVTIRTVPTVTKPRGFPLPFSLWAPAKVLLQVGLLLHLMLVTVPTLDVLVVQTPPAIPTLAVAWLTSLLRGCRVVVDWHNLAYTILAIGRGSERHWLVRLARAYERFFARVGQGNLCVTQAMSEWLRAEWMVHATVLHDQPPSFFRRAAPSEAHELFLRLSRAADLSEDLWEAAGATSESATGEERTLLTLRSAADEEARWREDRPALIVSSTSWTEDEDFGLLFEALDRLDARTKADSGFPRVLCAVTGKGPQRAAYEARLARTNWSKMRVKTLWLEASDYPLFLGCCDLGVSLHYSSSGLDLPMKVLDMFGAGMPVCAMGFASLPELVQDGQNGLVFSNSQQLEEQLHGLLAGFAGTTARLDALRANVRVGRWAENWLEHALPVILPAGGARPHAE